VQKVEFEVQTLYVIVNKMRNSGSKRKVGLSICQANVNRIWMKYGRTGATDNQPRSSRSKKTTERERKGLCRI